MTLEQEIEAIYKLDEARTQGEWICKVTPEGGSEYNDEDTACKDLHEVVTTDKDVLHAICSDQTYYPQSVHPEDQRFIASAPQMVSIIRRLYEGMTLTDLANQILEVDNERLKTENKRLQETIDGI